MAIYLDCSPLSIKSAASALRTGNLVAFPTETVYGLGADALNKNAISRIYRVKGRPKSHPLIVHVSSGDKVGIWAENIPEYAIKLSNFFWPGPMTLILTRTKLANDIITGGQENIAIRVPQNSFALQLLNEFEAQGGLGVVAPSANRFGSVSATSTYGVTQELGGYLNSTDIVLDGGICDIGIESTIVNCLGDKPHVVRPGLISRQMILDVIGEFDEFKSLKNQDYNVKVSGMFESHYSPKSKVLLHGVPRAGDGFFALKTVPTPTGAIRLDAPNNIEEYARNLYQTLRKADDMALKKIYVVPPEGEGLAIAIRDRLIKASFKGYLS